MAVRTDNCATGFSKIFAEKSFLYKNIVWTGWLDRQDGRTSAASNFHNRLRASGPWSRSVRMAKLQHVISISDARASGSWGGDVQTVEVESAVTIYDALASGPQLSDVRTVHFELQFLPYGDTRPDGIPHRLDSWLIFPFLELGKNQWTVRELIGVRTCCWNVRTEKAGTKASRYDVGVRTEEARCPDKWCLSVWCPDGMTRCSDGWNSRQMGIRTGWHIVRTADRELEILLTCRQNLLTSLWKWNPCLRHHYT
jgi:hypothetical protein